MIYLALFLICKLIAGAKNGSYYARKMTANATYLILYAVFVALVSILFLDVKYWAYISASYFVLSVLVIWQYVIFNTHQSKQIHLSESLLSLTTRLIFIFCGMDILLMILTSWLQDTFFKAPINLYIGRKIIEPIDGTNDPSGKTYDIWLGNYQINIPRISNGYIAFYLGCFGLGIWLLLSMLGYSFTLNDFI